MPDDVAVERSFAKARVWAEQKRASEKKVKGTREAALERADRREWAHARLGDEHRWQETVTRSMPAGTRRFVYDEAQGCVVEITA
jgi:hypothetical protein